MGLNNTLTGFCQAITGIAVDMLGLIDIWHLRVIAQLSASNQSPIP